MESQNSTDLDAKMKELGESVTKMYWQAVRSEIAFVVISTVLFCIGTYLLIGVAGIFLTLGTVFMGARFFIHKTVTAPTLNLLEELWKTPNPK